MEKSRSQGIVIVVICAFLILVFGVNYVTCQLDPGDQKVLNEMAAAVSGVDQSTLGWNLSDPCGSSRNLVCSQLENGYQRLTSMRIEIYPLPSGYIVDSIGNLTELTLLIITLLATTPIPESIQYLTKLTELTLVGASTTLAAQPIPQWLSTLPLLTTLTLLEMPLYGDVPVMPLLQTMVMRINGYAGPFPAAFRSMPYLKKVQIYGNKFYGPLPSWINELRYLEELELSSNRFLGPIPQLTLPRLKILIVHDNLLSGSPSFTTLPALTNLWLSVNFFEGNIQDATAGLNLSYCAVGYNLLDCPINYTTCECQEYASRPDSPPHHGDDSTTGLHPDTTSHPQTTNSACIGYECACSSNLTAIEAGATCLFGIWVISGSSANNQTIVVGESDRVIINGSFSQSSEGTLQIYSDGTSNGVQASGNVNLDGNLVIVVGTPVNNTSIDIIKGSSIAGEFKTITASSRVSKCKIEAKPTYGSSQVSVLLVMNCSNNKNKNRIILIAVIVPVGFIVIVVIVALIAILIYRRHQRGSAPDIRTSQRATKGLL